MAVRKILVYCKSNKSMTRKVNVVRLIFVFEFLKLLVPTGSYRLLQILQVITVSFIVTIYCYALCCHKALIFTQICTTYEKALVSLTNQVSPIQKFILCLQILTTKCQVRQFISVPPTPLLIPPRQLNLEKIY